MLPDNPRDSTPSPCLQGRFQTCFYSASSSECKSAVGLCSWLRLGERRLSANPRGDIAVMMREQKSMKVFAGLRKKRRSIFAVQKRPYSCTTDLARSRGDTEAGIRRNYRAVSPSKWCRTLIPSRIGFSIAIALSESVSFPTNQCKGLR
jgi:hypothetical protein